MRRSESSFLILAVSIIVGLILIRRKKISFFGKVAVITGGSRGLGLAIAQELSKEGAHLHLLARNAKELERAAQDLQASGTNVDVWTCDICDAAQVNGIIAAIVEKEGRIDLLVNNAGIILVAPLDNLKIEDFTSAMQTHFWGPLHTILSALPHLKKNRGGIVNIVSIGGRVAIPHLTSYCASKFALAGLSSSLRAELQKDGVRITTIFPGLMRTGSHLNAEFKGDCRKEFAWFSLGATTPLFSISAERAAQQIVAAAKTNKAELTITLQARLAATLQALAPNFFAFFISLINRILPQAKAGEEKRKGWQCYSWISPSALTFLGDRAAIRFNQLEPFPDREELKSQ